MPESLNTRVLRHVYNLWPCFRGTGARITYIAGDFREIRLEIPLSWRTWNYVGTIYGGSMYGAVDPVYMLMLIKSLGPGYVVWDKAAAIRFRKPGTSTLSAHFTLTEGQLREILEGLGKAPSLDRVFTVDLTAPDGTVHATVEKTLHIKKKN
jgi:hypothetical protein